MAWSSPSLPVLSRDVGGMGHYERTMAWVWRGVEKTRVVPIQRFRCTSCKQSFSFLPWFLLRFIWSAGMVVQKCWDEWNGGRATAQVAVRQGVSIRTVQRWFQTVWRKRGDLVETVGRHVSAPLPTSPPDPPRNHRPWSQHIRTLIVRYLNQAPLPAADSSRPPYYFVQSLK